MVNTYSPNDVSLYISGFRVTGWNTITVSRTDVNKMIKGIRGQNTRSVTHDTSCTISIELLQVVTANDVLDEVARLDQQRQTGRIQVFLKDNSGYSVVESTNAYIATPPDVVYGSELGTRTWIIQCLSAEYNVKGNETSLLDSLLNVFR